jgi:4-amino-4-deoxy-L-arabinose transferase-like glycosyltransferase
MSEHVSGLNPQIRGARTIDILIVLMVALFVNCIGIGRGPLAGTEGHRALVADQMVKSGDWILPRLYDQMYLAKPPLHYWILAGVEKLTGRADELVWRLPSAIAGALLAGFLCVMGGVWFGRLAGIVSGMACVSIVALWGQNHTAEIDAINSLASVITACLLIHLAFVRRERLVICALGAGLAFGAELLLKGPAGLAAVAGALIGPAVLNRGTRMLKRPWPWISLGIGSLMFLVYGVVALWRFHELHLPPETSGVNEIWINLLLDGRIRNLPQTLLVPVLMLAYGLPASSFLPMVFYGPMWRGSGDVSGRAGVWSMRDRRILRALVGTMVVACVLTMICGLWPPRYSYLWLPLICPVVGAAAAAFERGIYPVKIVDWMNIMLAMAGIGMTIGICVMGWLCWRGQMGHWVLLGACAILAAGMSGLVIRWIVKHRMALAGWGLVVIILAEGPPFGLAQIADRERRSGKRCAEIVAEMVRPGETLTTGHMVLDTPEIFYYSGVKVESYPNTLYLARSFPTSRWILFEDFEYAGWSRDVPDRLSRVRVISYRHFYAVLAWYTARGDSRPGPGMVLR